MNISTKQSVVVSLLRRINKKTIIIDNIGNKWNIEEKSIFIDSILTGFPLYLYFVINKDIALSQETWKPVKSINKILSLYEYFNNEFKLSSPNIINKDLLRHYFSDLDIYYQNRILEANINIAFFHNVNQFDYKKIKSRIKLVR